MNYLKIFFNTGLIFLTFLGVVISCTPESNVDDGAWELREEKIISELIEERPELSITLEALKKSYVYNAISTYGPYTFFAPTNEAWKNYFNRKNINGISEINNEILEAIFEYHILPFQKMTENFENGIMSEADTTVNGDRLLLDISLGLDNVIINNRSLIVESNIEAWNGVVHVVDYVLDPPILSIAQYLEAESDFSKFVIFLKSQQVFDTLNYLKAPVYPYNRNEFTIVALNNNQMEEMSGFIDSVKIVDSKYDEEVAKNPEYAKRVSKNQLKELARSYIIAGMEFATSMYSGYKKTLAKVPYGDGILRMKMVVNSNGITANDRGKINLKESDVILKNGLVHRVDKPFGFLSESPRNIIFSAYPIERWNTTQGAVVSNNNNEGYLGDEDNYYGIANLDPQTVGAGFWVEIPNVPAGRYNLTLIVRKQGSKAKIIVDDKMLMFPGVGSDGSYDFSYLLGNRGSVDDITPTPLSNSGLNLFEVPTGIFEVVEGQEKVSIKLSTTYINPAGAKIAISAFVIEPLAE